MKLRAISKMLGAGVGAALAKVVMMFVPETVRPDQQQAIEFLIYTGVTMLAVYLAPANTDTEAGQPQPS